MTRQGQVDKGTNVRDSRSQLKESSYVLRKDKHNRVRLCPKELLNITASEEIVEHYCVNRTTILDELKSDGANGLLAEMQLGACEFFCRCGAELTKHLHEFRDTLSTPSPKPFKRYVRYVCTSVDLVVRTEVWKVNFRGEQEVPYLNTVCSYDAASGKCNCEPDNTKHKLHTTRSSRSTYSFTCLFELCPVYHVEQRGTNDTYKQATVC